MQRRVLLTRGGLAGGFPFGFAASLCLLWKGFVLECGEQSSQVTSDWISLACFKCLSLSVGSGVW